MNRLLPFALPLLLISSCAPAVAQDRTRPAPADSSREGGALDRLHVYEVDPAQLAGAARDTATAFIDVSGTAEVSADPDVVRITFAVETLRETAREAGEENANRMNEVFRALRGTGIPGLVIETFGYNLQPNYRRPGPNDTRPLQIESFRATNNIRVTADEVNAAGRLIDAAIQSGANRVASLSFDLSDAEPLRMEALRRAVNNAAAQARVIADALGVPLGPPIEVRGGAERPFQQMDGARMMEMANAPTPIEAGASTVTATVTVRYRLGGPSR